jgi:hypothetical protein
LQRWHTLPASGGLRDQDYRGLRRLSIAWDTYQIFSAYEAAEDKLGWRGTCSDQAEWLDTVLDLIGDLAYGDN